MKNRSRIVSYDIAKLLKENGFDEEVYFRIYPDGTLATSGYLCDYNSKEDTYGFSAPTYSEVIDWFLDAYGIFIEIDYIRIPYNYDKKYKYFVIDVDDEDDDFGGDVIIRSENAYGTRDEAIEAALRGLLRKMKDAARFLKEQASKPTVVDGIEIKTNKEKVEIITE